jgi:peptide/nickel transport system substrate-binding protein
VPGEGGEGRNRARYRSAEAGRLLDEASRVRDITRRRELYAELAARMLEDLPVLALWHEDQVAVVSERARGFELSAEGRWAAIAGIP